MDLIVELRQYTLRPGARDTLIELFEREFVTGQEAAGITLGGRFRDLDDPDRFVWLRSFPDMAARERALRAFYGGPVWRVHREAANATMLDSDDVLLLRGPGFAAPDSGGPVVATVCHPLDAEAFAEHFERRLRPALTAAGSAPTAVHRTEHAQNTFPALPVRTGEEVLVWFTGGAAGAAGAAGELPELPDLSDHLRAAPQRIRLEPVGGRVPGRGEGSDRG
ncbi:NIPSNAP family protein [Streptomyces subrutilus]|uniref:NIPSNAP family protein n=1 Tax=Streptomyces subrutilus TaxID=36818 RepID=UPI0034020945